MSAALEVVLERGSYVVGDQVRGRVQILVDQPTCKRLTVRLEYLGKRLGAQKATEVHIAEGPLLAGHSHGFVAVIPRYAPFSCEGKEHAVAWRARAQADVPWAIDPKGDASFEVLPLETSDEAQIEGLTAIAPVEEKPTSLGCAVLTWVGVAALVTLCLPLLPVLLIIIAHQRVLASRLTGFVVELPERRFLLGEWVPLTVRFRLKKPVEVERFTVSFQGTEKWTTGSGNSRRTHYHHFHDETVELAADTILALRPLETLGGGGLFGGIYRARQEQPANTSPDFVYASAVRLPLDGLPSAGTSVYYQVSAKLQLRGWPNADATAKVRTLGGRFTGPSMKPETPALDTSGRSRIAFVAKGEPAPEGVDLSTARGTTGRWILLSTLGLAAAGAGVGLWLDGAPSPYLALAVAGGVMLIVGIWRFVAAVR